MIWSILDADGTNGQKKLDRFCEEMKKLKIAFVIFRPLKAYLDLKSLRRPWFRRLDTIWSYFLQLLWAFPGHI